MDGELIFWAVAAVAGALAGAVLYAQAKRNAEKYTEPVDTDFGPVYRRKIK